MPKRLTYEEVVKILKDRGYEPLFKEYINSSTKLPAINPEGYGVCIGLPHFKNGFVPNIFCTNNIFTLQNIQMYIDKNGLNATLLTKKYLNNKQRLSMRCKNDDYVWESSLNEIRSRKPSCPKCRGVLPVYMDHVIAHLSKISPEIEIASDYIEGRIINITKIKCKCKICGREWTPIWGTLKSGHGCPNLCMRTDRFKQSRLDKYLEIKAFLADKNIEIISEKYIARKEKLDLKCKECHNEWSSPWGSLVGGCGCPKCADRKNGEKSTIPLEQIKERIYSNDNSWNIKIIKEVKKGTSGRLLCECKIDGNVWECNASHLINGHNCPECAKRTHGGLYCITLAERHKEEWESKDAMIYYLRCKNESEMFYKIGITARKDIRDRINSIPYEVEVLKTEKTNLYDAVYLEKELHEEHIEYIYSPKIKFGGYTECFSSLLMLDE